MEKEIILVGVFLKIQDLKIQESKIALVRFFVCFDWDFRCDQKHLYPAVLVAVFWTHASVVSQGVAVVTLYHVVRRAVHSWHR
jgi:hypothetical protein